MKGAWDEVAQNQPRNLDNRVYWEPILGKMVRKGHEQNKGQNKHTLCNRSRVWLAGTGNWGDWQAAKQVWCGILKWEDLNFIVQEIEIFLLEKLHTENLVAVEFKGGETKEEKTNEETQVAFM